MGIQFATNMYGTYRVPPGVTHRPAVRRVLAGEVYEPRTIAFMAANAGQGDIVHAGMFFGDFLPGLSQGLANGARIWGFEPNPENFEHACETIRLNALANVSPINAAVSHKDGQLLFKTRDENGRPMGGHSRCVQEEGDGVQAVPAIRLDDVIAPTRHVSILQLDVEGHERPALLGATNLIKRCKPILILEDFPRHRWIRNKFGHLGYRLQGKLHGNVIWSTEPLRLKDY